MAVISVPLEALQFAPVKLWVATRGPAAVRASGNGIRAGGGRRRGHRGAADIPEHAVVVLGAAHRDREDILGACIPAGRDRIQPEDAHEECAHRGADRDLEAPIVAGCLRGCDGHAVLGDTTAGHRVAVLGGLIDRGLNGLGLVARQPDDPGQRSGIGRLLDPVAVDPVPGDVDHDRQHADEDEDRGHVDDQNLAARPPIDLRSGVHGLNRSRDFRMHHDGAVSGRVHGHDRSL